MSSSFVATQAIAGQGVTTVNTIQNNLLANPSGYQLTAAQQLAALLAQAAAGALVVKDTSTNTTTLPAVTVDSLTGSGAGSLKVRLGPGAGHGFPGDAIRTNPPKSIVSVAGSDLAGTITITIGPFDSTFGFDICHIDFLKPYTINPVIILTAANLTTSRLINNIGGGSSAPYIMPYRDPDNELNPGFPLVNFTATEVIGAGFVLMSDEMPLLSGVTYKWNYLVVQPYTV
jgi:hypothetical protein